MSSIGLGREEVNIFVAGADRKTAEWVLLFHYCNNRDTALRAGRTPATPLHGLARSGDPMPWVLDRGDQRWEGVPPARATANPPELLMRMALDGAGIAAVNDHFALPYLQRGELVQVLPDWRLPRSVRRRYFRGDG